METCTQIRKHSVAGCGLRVFSTSSLFFISLGHWLSQDSWTIANCFTSERKKNSLNIRRLTSSSLETCRNVIFASLLVPPLRKRVFVTLMCRLFAVLLLFYVLCQPIAEGKLACPSLLQHHLCCERLQNIFPLDLPVYTLQCFRSKFSAQTEYVSFMRLTINAWGK